MTEKNEITQYKENLNPNDLQTLSQYGFDIQEELGNSATELSNQINVSDADDIGEQLVAMQAQIGSIELGEVKSTGLRGLVQGFVKKGKLSIIESQARRDSVAVSVSKIAENLEKSANQLRSDCDIAASIASDAQSYNKKLEEAIADLDSATEQVNTELSTCEDEDRKMQLNRALDIMVRRKNALLTSQAMASQQYNSMQILISGNSALIEDMHTAIHTTIPSWRAHLNAAVIIHRQDVNSRVKKAVSDTTNKMLRTTAENLKTSSIRIANEANRPVVDMETIKDVQNKMTETITAVTETYRKASISNAAGIKQLEVFKEQNEKAMKSIGYLEADTTISHDN